MTNPRLWRLGEIVLRSKEVDALAGFYRSAFDFVDEPSRVADGRSRSLVLGDTHLRVVPAGPEAASYPDDVPCWNPLFQHFALRVADMDAAVQRLEALDRWRPISTDGPERLPANTGGVAAFKFRDPEGHPLELLAFPDRRSGPLFAGIDHAAISVADLERSLAFYEGLGLVVAGRSLNTGPEQSRLDAVDDAIVDVVTLRMPSGRAPHVELLAYRGTYDRERVALARRDDVAATCLVMEVEERASGASDRTTLRDPDGHRLLIDARS